MYVRTTHDTVTIITDEGTEVAHWTLDELQEDPSLGITIAGAIDRAHTEPGELVDDLFTESFGTRVERGPHYPRIDEQSHY